jgi:hypothetical protein
MGIFHRGSNDLVIRGQAIGTDTSAGEDKAAARRAARMQARADRLADGADAHDGVANTGTGSVTITNSTVGGEYVRRRTH